MNLTSRTLVSPPLRLAGREELRHTRGRCRTDVLGGASGDRSHQRRIAKMRNIDRNEQLRRSERDSGVPIQRLNSGAVRTRGKQSAQQIDQEGQPEAFGPPEGSSIPAIAGWDGCRVPSDFAASRRHRLPGLFGHADLTHCRFAGRHVEHDGDRRLGWHAIAIGLFPTTRSAPPGAGISGRVLHMTMPTQSAFAAWSA